MILARLIVITALSIVIVIIVYVSRFSFSLILIFLYYISLSSWNCAEGGTEESVETDIETGVEAGAETDSKTGGPFAFSQNDYPHPSILPRLGKSSTSLGRGGMMRFWEETSIWFFLRQFISFFSFFRTLYVWPSYYIISKRWWLVFSAIMAYGMTWRALA